MYILAKHHLPTNYLAGGLGVHPAVKRWFLNTGPALPQCCSPLVKIPHSVELHSKYLGFKYFKHGQRSAPGIPCARREENKKMSPREHYFCHPPAVLHSDTNTKMMHIFRYCIFLLWSIILLYHISVKFQCFIASWGCPSKYYWAQLENLLSKPGKPSTSRTLNICRLNTFFGIIMFQQLLAVKEYTCAQVWCPNKYYFPI